MRSLCAFLIACILLPASANKTAVHGAATAEDPLGGLTRKVFALVNRQRRLHGVHELAWSDALAAQAHEHSINMMERGFFSHTDPIRGTPAARLRAAGIPWRRCGENILREYGAEEPADDAVEKWMKNDSHRQSLLDPRFTHTGVGIAISPDTEYFITQEFISR